MNKKQFEELVHELANNGVDWYPGYSEPGYKQPRKGVLVANWNHVGIEESEAEKHGYGYEWNDEWVSCDDCGNIVRTSPNGWGWTKSWGELDGDILCHKCIKKSWAEEYLASLENRPKQCLTFSLPLVAVQPPLSSRVRLGAG